MVKLDLPGVKHDKIHDTVEDFILCHDPPLEIITGNSSKMKQLVIEKLSEYDFQYRYKDWMNLGSLIIYETDDCQRSEG